MEEVVQEEKKKGFNLKKLLRKIALKVAFVLFIAIISVFLFSYFTSNSKSTKLGFEDIGELDTQAAYVTVVDVIDNPRKLFGAAVPFTDSKYIYSYDVVVKAGLNFKNIKWSASKSHKTIKVELPKPYITDIYLVEDSMQVYYEKETIFSNITMLEESSARKKLIEKGKQDAIDNGLMKHTKENTELLLTKFFLQHKEYQKYKIVYEWEN